MCFIEMISMTVRDLLNKAGGKVRIQHHAKRDKKKEDV